MFYLSKIGNLLDDIDSTQTRGTDNAEARALTGQPVPQEASLLGRGLGLLSSATAAATAAASAAASVGAVSSVSSLGGVTSAFAAVLADHDAGDEGHQAEEDCEPQDAAVGGEGAVEDTPCMNNGAALPGTSDEVPPVPCGVDDGVAPVVADVSFGSAVPHACGTGDRHCHNHPASAVDAGTSCQVSESDPETRVQARAAVNDAEAYDSIGNTETGSVTPRRGAEHYGQHRLVEDHSAELAETDAATMPEAMTLGALESSKHTAGGSDTLLRSPGASSSTSQSARSAATSEGYTRVEASASAPAHSAEKSVSCSGLASALVDPEAIASGVCERVPTDSGDMQVLNDAVAGGGHYPAENIPAARTTFEEIMAENIKLKYQIDAIEKQAALQRAEDEATLTGATQQIERLQGRIDELDLETAKKSFRIKQLDEQLDEARRCLREESANALRVADAASAAAEDSKATEKHLLQQVEALRRDVLAAQQKAREEAAKEKDATLGEVREEMEQELERMLKQKDDQVRTLEARLSGSEKTRREQSREIERLRAELETLQEEVMAMKREREDQLNDHRRELEAQQVDQQRQVQDLELRLQLEERQKHELAMSLRSVEERTRSEVAQLEVQKTQLELQQAGWQAQLQEEQLKNAELALSVGELRQQLAHMEDSKAANDHGEARILVETRAHQLAERLQVAEEKLLDAQSMRDMFAKETDMYRLEIKASKEERRRLEEELERAQERARSAEVVQAQIDPTVGRDAAISLVQKEFEGRIERYRDEVQYLRQKCEEKERRCEQLLSERSSLAVELRNLGGNLLASPAALSSEKEELLAGDLEAGSKSAAKPTAPLKVLSSRTSVRSLPLAAPAWLRSSDEPLRLVVRTLSTYPQARLVFFTYIILLHVWVLFVLQQSAVQ